MVTTSGHPVREAGIHGLVVAVETQIILRRKHLVAMVTNTEVISPRRGLEFDFRVGQHLLQEVLRVRIEGKSPVLGILLLLGSCLWLPWLLLRGGCRGILEEGILVVELLRGLLFVII